MAHRARWLHPVLRCRGGGVLALSVLLLGVVLSSCSSAPGPSATLTRYLTAWSDGNYRAMAALVLHPPADFVTFNRQVAAELDLEHAHYAARPAVVQGSAATAAVTGHLVLTPFGPWTVHSTLHLRALDNGWKVAWSPASIIPELPPGDQLSTTVSWPPRAPITGADGALLTVRSPQVTVGVEGSRITSTATVTAALEQAGATPAQVSGALSTATAHPQWFVPVFDVTQARYAQIKPAIYPVPGTVFQTHSARGAATAGLAAHVVGSVGPITAQELSRLGPPYQANDTIGQSGLEQADERRLAGRPGGHIEVVTASGASVTTVARFAAHGGRPVATTIDPTIQGAAEAALAGVTQPAALVAIQASTGKVLASVSDPTSDAFDNALTGSFPPGSTFKIVTSADLIEHGASPSSPAHCPATITVDGQTFHNFEGEARPSLTLDQAFAQSCNAAFIGLAGALPDNSFTATAAQFGIGDSFSMGISAFGGKVPTPDSDAQRAATSIGQANVLVSPLAMATAAAAVDSGHLHQPRLVVGAADDRAPVSALNATVVADLRTMMAAVVNSPEGTAANAGLPAGTFGKTGTAEFGTTKPLQTHAWFIGYRGDLAFAVLVVGGGIGGAVAAPLAAKFLDAVPAS